MPFQDVPSAGGSGSGSSGGGWFGVTVPTPVIGPTGQFGTIQLPVGEALAQASQVVKQIPTAPDPGNLPGNARPGQMASFTTQPEFVYVLGADYVWRAMTLIAVV